MSFYLVSGGAATRLDHDWIKKHMPTDRSVSFTDITNSMGVLVLAGPKSRELLQRLTRTICLTIICWLSAKIDVGLAPALAARVNFVGELGWNYITRSISKLYF